MRNILGSYKHLLPVCVDVTAGHRPRVELVVFGHADQTVEDVGVGRETDEARAEGGLVLLEVDQLMRFAC